VAGLGVPSLASLATLDLEDAKVPQFDTALFEQRVDNAFKSKLYDLFDLKLC
jgi:hypothetical protein